MSAIPPEALTIILATSPTPSNPSTELVSDVLESLPHELSQVPLIITFDSFTVLQNDKYLDGRLKRGQIPQRMADTYAEYINNVKRIFTSANLATARDPTTDALVSWTSSADPIQRSVTFIQHQRHQGFALSVKSTIRYCQTPNVLVLQHDWVFDGPSYPPISDLLHILNCEEEVSYITFVARYSKNYEHAKGQSNARLRAVFNATQALRSGRMLNVDLVACLHFFDRPHLATVQKYHEIFDSTQLKRGDFLEDGVGARYSNSIGSAVSDEQAYLAWKVIGAWMYAPEKGGSRTIRHTSGRTTLTKLQQEKRIEAYIRENQQARRENRSPQHRPVIDDLSKT